MSLVALIGVHVYYLLCTPLLSRGLFCFVVVLILFLLDGKLELHKD